MATARNERPLCRGLFWYDIHRICMCIPNRRLTDFWKRNLNPHMCNTINFIHSYKSRDHVGNHDITQGVFNNRNIKYNRNRNTEKRVLFQNFFYPHLHYSTHLKTQSRYSIMFDNILFFILTHAQPKRPLFRKKAVCTCFL